MALEDSNISFQLPPLIWGWEFSNNSSQVWGMKGFLYIRLLKVCIQMVEGPFNSFNWQNDLSCRRCFPIQRKINLECFTLAGMYLLPLLHCKFVVLCFSTLSFVNSDTTIFNRRRLFLRMFFNIQCITQKDKPSFTVSEGHGHPLVMIYIYIVWKKIIKLFAFTF
jgi:hypothetical protein